MKRLLIAIGIAIGLLYFLISPTLYFLILKHDMTQMTIKATLDLQETRDHENALASRVNEIQYEVDVLTQKDEK